MINNCFLIINLNPWPIILTLNLFTLIIQILNLILFKNFNFLVIINLIILIIWIKRLKSYKILKGYDSFFINTRLKYLILFTIITEAMFFSTFFYIFFANSFLPNIYFNLFWIIKRFKINFLLSFLNTYILILSRLTISIYFNLIIKKNFYLYKYFYLTLFLGACFSLIQLYEFYFIKFTFSDSIFWSNFFTLTSFHISHVIVGLIRFLSININKFLILNYKIKIIIWYWHFIDLIWILIFTLIYLYFINI